MKKTLSKIAATIIALSLLTLILPISAFADDTAKTEIFVNSLQHKDPLIVGKDVNIVVQVQSDNPDNPTKTVKNEDSALVYASISNKKGESNKDIQLQPIGNGTYQGTIKFSEAGEWKVSVMALMLDASLGKNGMNTMETTWNVVEPHLPVWVWVVIVVGAVLVLLLIFYMVKRSRREKVRLEEEKKERLKAQKNKKHKKKR